MFFNVGQCFLHDAVEYYAGIPVEVIFERAEVGGDLHALRMEMDELTATCVDGIAYPDGWLPSGTKYQTLKRYGHNLHSDYRPVYRKAG